MQEKELNNEEVIQAELPGQSGNNSGIMKAIIQSSDASNELADKMLCEDNNVMDYRGHVHEDFVEMLREKGFIVEDRDEGVYIYHAKYPDISFSVAGKIDHTDYDDISKQFEAEQIRVEAVETSKALILKLQEEGFEVKEISPHSNETPPSVKTDEGSQTGMSVPLMEEKENTGWVITHPEHEDVWLQTMELVDNMDYSDAQAQLQVSKDKKEMAARKLVEYKSRAEALINKRVFLNQKFGIGEYNKATEFKVHRFGFMHVYYTLMGTNKPLEAWGYGEISNEMLFINIMYGTGSNTGYRILPAKDCFILLMPYADFVEICADFEKDIEYRGSDEYKAEVERKKASVNKPERGEDPREAEIKELKEHSEQLTAEVNYMKFHPSAAWLKHFWNKWHRSN